MRVDELGKEAVELWVIWSKSPTAKGIRTFIIWAFACEAVGWCWLWAWAIAPWTTIILTFPVIWLLLCELPFYLVKRQATREMAEDEKKDAEFLKEWDAMQARSEAKIAAAKATKDKKRKKKA